MSLPPDNHSIGRVRLKRAALVLVGAAVFLGVSSVVKPPPQAANARPNGDNFARALRDSYGNPVEVGGPSSKEREQTKQLRWRQILAQPAPTGWKLLGSLQGREFLTLCYSTSEGPRYSVFGADGKLMQADMRDDEVYRSFPDVDLENMHLDPGNGVPIMLMDKDRD